MLEHNSTTFIGLSLVCQLLYRTFHQAPNDELLSIIYDEELAADWAVEITNDKLKQGLALLTNKPRLEEVTQDFSTLFIGPNKLKAAPWGSVYLTEEQNTFGKQTLAIRQYYANFGLAIDTGEHEPDDHIGLIFSFVAHCCELNTQELESNGRVNDLAIRDFLTQHVLTWAPRMLQTMYKNAETPFYQGMALVAEGTLQQLAELVKAQYLIVNLYR